MTEKRRGGVHAKNYVVHIPLAGFERAWCGRTSVNFFGSQEEAERDLDAEVCCRQCRAKFRASTREPTLPLSRVRELLAEQREACAKSAMDNYYAARSVCVEAVRSTPLVAIDAAKETT